jgi:hypothetical protein
MGPLRPPRFIGTSYDTWVQQKLTLALISSRKASRTTTNTSQVNLCSSDDELLQLASKQLPRSPFTTCMSWGYSRNCCWWLISTIAINSMASTLPRVTETSPGEVDVLIESLHSALMTLTAPWSSLVLDFGVRDGADGSAWVASAVRLLVEPFLEGGEAPFMEVAAEGMLPSATISARSTAAP